MVLPKFKMRRCPSDTWTSTTPLGLEILSSHRGWHRHSSLTSVPTQEVLLWESFSLSPEMTSPHFPHSFKGHCLHYCIDNPWRQGVTCFYLIPYWCHALLNKQRSKYTQNYPSPGPKSHALNSNQQGRPRHLSPVQCVCRGESAGRL